jgi:3-hydroxyisobutyrate dehydrogenase-like beta-hydroxyacid dehydrogenase
MVNEQSVLGFIGLGAMGGPMVLNLLKAGYEVHAFDLDPERLGACVQAGAQPSTSAAEVVSKAQIVLLSLPSSDAFVAVAEETLIMHALPGQIYVDLGTTTPPETRRLAAAIKGKGALLLDAPVSGGPSGAEQARLFMFVGGDPVGVERSRRILDVLGGSGVITYCGPSGSGQIVKGVNQLMMGLGCAAYIEAMAFGVRAGVDASVIHAAMGETGRWRADFSYVAGRVAAGKGEELGVKFRELPYFLREAREQGFRLPLTEVLQAVCDAGPRVTIDDNRHAPSFWHELMDHTHTNE